MVRVASAIYIIVSFQFLEAQGDESMTGENQTVQESRLKLIHSVNKSIEKEKIFYDLVKNITPLKQLTFL
jgi:hypothetical protein